MTKYIYLYRSPAASTAQPTAEESEARMAAFTAWMERTGPALVDVGSPFGASSAISDDGTPASPGDLRGYTIIEADARRGRLARHRRTRLLARHRDHLHPPPVG
jgi:hypothetical protein